MVVIVPVDKETSRIAGTIEILSRGFVDPEGREDVLEDAKRVVAEALAGHDHLAEIGGINARVKDAMNKFIYDRTRRKPMVLPVAVEV